MDITGGILWFFECQQILGGTYRNVNNAQRPLAAVQM
jgi:hypothetical protein